MKHTIQIKVDRLTALSKQSKTSVNVVRKEVGAAGDSLSNSIRTRKDAEIFSRELSAAFKSAKNKH